MSIKIAQNGESQQFIIETENTSYILGTCDGYLNNLYWGEKVLCPQEINRLRICGNTGANRSERKRVFDEYPAFGGKFYDNESLKVTFADGVRETVIKYDSYVLSDDKKELTIIMKDEVYPLTVSLKYKIYEGLDIIDRCAEIKNEGDDEMTLETFDSANWTLPYNEHYRLTYMASNCLHEYEVKRCDLGLNTVLLQSKSGKSNTGNYPYFAVDDYTATEHKGCVWFGTLQWSGNWQIKAGKDITRNAKITGGVSNFDCDIVLGSKESFKTPIFSGGFTSSGFGAASRQFHNYQRKTSATAFTNKVMPMIYNAWSTFTFNIDQQLLFEQAKRCADLGIELFVIDDGWFGERDDDTKSLGDWFPSPKKFPNGLKPVVDYINSLGMKFGIWIEPEMVNPDSDMFRAHPDWVLKPTANRLPMQGRTQQVVDLTNPDAYAYIYGAMDKLVGELGIDYIKWDHNKLVTEEVSPLTGRPAAHAQTLAVYRIFTDLKAAHPGLEIESCSSGGGRIDLGILEVADRVWASDCVDPVERADIQRYTSLLVPPEMIGEHVGASPAHSTHRATSQEMRMATAFFGHMGIEWNLLKEPQEDIDKLSEWTAEFKKHREWFAVDTVVHSDAADPAVRVDGCVMPNKAAAIYRFTQLTTSQTYPSAPVRLPGLDPDAVYVVSPLDVSLDLVKQDIGNGQSPLGWWTADGVKMTGRALAAYGIRPPALHPAQAVLFKVVRI